MYVLNVEDNAWKHRDICKVLQGCGAEKIDSAATLEEALKLIDQSVSQNQMYDLIVTDMYFPEAYGGAEIQAGMQLIEKVTEMECDIPIIVCSSAQFRIPGILGSIHYSQRTNWENDLRELVRKCL